MKARSKNWRTRPASRLAPRPLVQHHVPLPGTRKRKEKREKRKEEKGGRTADGGTFVSYVRLLVRTEGTEDILGSEKEYWAE